MFCVSVVTMSFFLTFLLSLGVFASDQKTCDGLFTSSESINPLINSIETPKGLVGIQGIMVFDSHLRKVITVSFHEDSGVLKHFSKISQFYVDLAKIVVDHNSQGEIVRIWPLLPNGVYELFYLRVMLTRDQPLNEILMGRATFSYESIGDPIRFGLENGIIKIKSL